MGKFQSSKVFDGFSTVFRQWKAETTHCRFIHGYGISFKVYFEGNLDERNWVWDFGGMKRAKTQIDGMSPKAWMDYMFDHTLVVAEDDPMRMDFEMMHNDQPRGKQYNGPMRIRIVPATGAEKFAEYIYDKLNDFVHVETKGRVRVTKVKFMEHGKNAACYIGE